MKTRYFALLPIAMLSPESAFSCGEREYESCWQVDLPWPLGEARDCKCLPKLDLPPPVQDVNNEAKRLLENVAREVKNTPQAIQECLSDGEKCVKEIISAPLALAVQAYIDGLYRQSEGRSYPLSKEFIALAQPYYSVDLKSITWAFNIDTGSGMSVSYCDRIFFAGTYSPWESSSNLHHVLHELEHTVQCQARGKRTYLAEYVLKVGMDVLKTGRLDVHDIHDYEVAADAKANQATSPIWAQIENGADRPDPVNTGTSGTMTANITDPIPAPEQERRFCQTQFGFCQVPPR